MLFGSRRKKFNSTNSITIDNHKLNRVKYLKCLGVCIDEDLSWKFHTSYISLKISKSLGIFNKLKFTLPRDVL